MGLAILHNRDSRRAKNLRHYGHGFSVSSLEAGGLCLTWDHGTGEREADAEISISLTFAEACHVAAIAAGWSAASSSSLIPEAHKPGVLRIDRTGNAMKITWTDRRHSYQGVLDAAAIFAFHRIAQHSAKQAGLDGYEYSDNLRLAGILFTKGPEDTPDESV